MRVLGHDTHRAHLAAAVRNNSLHHAYLFEGPVGLGKRTVANWLAQLANCRGESSDGPCGRCDQCVRIAAGSHPDVIVLAPESGRASQRISVDMIREVLRKAGYHRYDSRRRFILIDPADALAAPAANALLKTLEEPPPGTGFILISTSASRLLPTIVSRCQRFRFGAVDASLISGWLHERGCSNVEQAAAMSLGCPGRALTLAEGEIEDRRALRELVVELSTSPTAKTIKMIERLVKGKPRATWLSTVEKLFEIVEELLRDVVILSTDAPTPLLHPDATDLVSEWGRRLYPGGITKVATALAEARSQLVVNVSGRLVLEAVFTKLASELGKA